MGWEENALPCQLSEAVMFSATQKEKATKVKGELTLNPEIAEPLS